MASFFKNNKHFNHSFPNCFYDWKFNGSWFLMIEEFDGSFLIRLFLIERECVYAERRTKRQTAFNKRWQLIWADLPWSRQVIPFLDWPSYTKGWFATKEATSLSSLSYFFALWFYGSCVKSRFFKNRDLYWYNLPQNSNLGQERFVQKTGVQIPVGEGQIFCHFSCFLYLFHFVHKKLNIKT